MTNSEQRSYARADIAGSGVAVAGLFATSSGFESVLAPVAPALRMSMPPLKNAPSSIEMRAATTSPVSDPSLRMSTRSLAVRLPRTFPSTTISRALMFAATTPLRPIVTRLPERLIDPSTRPSMYKDSEPVTSPLITSDLPIVAWSEVVPTTGRGAAGGSLLGTTGAVVAVDALVRSGSAGRPGVAGWFVGFHIFVEILSFY